MTEENNPFKKERKTEEWPAEVVERLSMQAERTGDAVSAAVEQIRPHSLDAS